jgi:hypothetical protein
MVIAIASVGVGACVTPVAEARPLDAPPAASAAQMKRVPNEVGKNHQAAQDHLQSLGFYALREKDCTGQGRLLVWDRNWKVVRQTPKAGKRVSTDTTITLCSVKYSD